MKFENKHLSCGLLAAVSSIIFSPAASASISSFNDIDYWVGSGSNQAALIIDFNDGKSPEAWAWGYRWNGSKNGGDMILAIAAVDPRMSLVNGGSSTAVFITEISYDGSAGLQSGTSDFTFGVDTSWGYYNAIDTAEAVADNWTAPGIGASSRALSDGNWDAWSFGKYDSLTFDHTVPPNTASAIAAPVPEPETAVALLAVTALLFASTQRRRRL